MMLSTWVQYTWNLAQLPLEAPRLDKRFSMDLAELPGDIALLDAAISRSYSMESAWAHDLAPRVKLARELLEHYASTPDVHFITVKHGHRIIGASIIRESADKPTNLPVGVCVLNEYRCRGIGTSLLHNSLLRLKERGVETVRVISKKGLAAERYLYPKYGGVRQVFARSCLEGLL
jgi:ribosomal protein S18 acetylase RimI-like enzyme